MVQNNGRKLFLRAVNPYFLPVVKSIIGKWLKNNFISTYFLFFAGSAGLVQCMNQ